MPPVVERRIRRAIATYVVDNTGTPEDLRERVAEVYADLIAPRSP